MAIVDRYITCSNADGFSITFGERGLTPFVLVEAEGCYGVANNVTISENTMTDGGAYQGSVAKIRNIVLTVQDLSDHTYNRNLLAALFKSGETGTLVFHEEENDRKIEYYVESITSTGQASSRTYQISLLCPDPFFYALSNVNVMLSAWLKGFEFVHQFTANGEEFGYRSNERLKNIENQNAADGIGMTITVAVSGTVQNPSIVRVDSNEAITIGSSLYPFDMLAGDTLTITTSDNDKHVYLTRNGVTTEVNQYITEDSTFIQLQRGDNNIGYNAAVGEDAMTVVISYRLKYAGA